MKFSKKQIVSFIVISILIAAVPPTIYLLQQKQIIKSNALEPTQFTCTPDSGIPPYQYTAGALEIWTYVIEENGAKGPIPGVKLRADQLSNNTVSSGPNAPKPGGSDGDMCGYKAWGITDANGHVNLEPLNCAHNNFRVHYGDINGDLLPGQDGLPPDVKLAPELSEFQPDVNDQNKVQTGINIGNLALGNGYAGVLKLFYNRLPSVQPTPTPTPPSSCIGQVCTCSGASAGSCDQCNGGWCKGGFCETCSPAPTPTPTPPSCPVPNTVTNIRINCPYCP